VDSLGIRAKKNQKAQRSDSGWRTAGERQRVLGSADRWLGVWRNAFRNDDSPNSRHDDRNTDSKWCVRKMTNGAMLSVVLGGFGLSMPAAVGTTAGGIPTQRRHVCGRNDDRAKHEQAKSQYVVDASSHTTA